MQMTHYPKDMQLSPSTILGEKKSRKQVLAEIHESKEVQILFETFPEKLQEEMIAFCMGRVSLKMTYDPFFKFIFNPLLHPGRLSELLSLLLEEEVEVIDVLPNESSRVTEVGTLLITDIVVLLSDGSYANVEIQRLGYQFPGQRCASYSSDLLQRQIIRAKGMARKEQRKFSYGDLKKVYTIVFIEESPAVYWQYPNQYIHRSRQVFDTGLDLDLLQEFIIIPLDVFLKIEHNEMERLDAWLYFIGSNNPNDIFKIIEAYPDFVELYSEMIDLRYNMRELSGMYESFRQILREMDADTLQIMIAERKKEMEEKEQQLQEKERRLQEKEKWLAESEKQLAESEKQLAENEKHLLEKERENEALRKRILELEKMQGAG